MEQLELFNIETILIEPIEKNTQIKTKRNKLILDTQISLLDKVSVDVKKVSFKVCDKPKTYKMIPYNWTEEQKAKYKASHYDEKGRFIFEPAGDFTILQGSRNRE